MHLLFTFPWVDPRNNPREPTGTPEEWYSMGTFFSLQGKGVVSFQKTAVKRLFVMRATFLGKIV